MTSREPAERVEGIADLDAIEIRMTAAVRDDGGCGAASGCLLQIVVTVGRLAMQRDEYCARLERASVDADAAGHFDNRCSRIAADELAASCFDNFAQRELALIGGDR